ncbi:glycosyltransferase family 1 protein [Corallococcus sp. H22C18031201]|nr:glycosyltransferase family 1 protein [Corallococcus sp. H22C18031201]
MNAPSLPRPASDAPPIPGVRPIKVLHYLENIGMTGVETFLLMLCESQARSGRVVPAIACVMEDREELQRSARALDIRVIPLPSPAGSGSGLGRKLRSARLRAERVSTLSRLLKREEMDALHVHAVGIAGMDAFVAAELAGTPSTLVTHHATLEWFRQGGRPSRMSDATFWLEKQRVSRAVMPYAAAARELEAHGMPAARVSVVPFCVDLKKFPGRPERAVLPDAPFRLLMAARLVPGKGHAELLSAVASLKDRHPRLKLVIAGSGPLSDDIAAQVISLGLSEVVELTGHLSNERMPALLATADAIVLPSYMPGETFPISLLEAMATGLPAIGTRWFGIPDIIDDSRTGYLVEPRDAAGLARAIDALVSDPTAAARMGLAGQQRARTEFSSDGVAARYEHLYRAGL